MKNIKKISTYLLATASLVLSVSSCGSEDMEQGMTNSPETSQPVAEGFMKLRLTMPETTTKAGEVEDDFRPATDPEEKAIANVLILYYDNDGNYLGKTESPYTETDGTDYIEKTINFDETNVVPVELFREGNPVKAVAYLNYDSSWGLPGKSLSEIEALQLPYQVTIEGKPYFVISSTGYFDGFGSYMTTTDISNYVFPTTEEASVANTVTVFVERLAARVDLSLPAPKPISVYHNGTQYDLQFTVDSWGVTASEKTEFLLKKSHVRNAYNTELGYDFPGFANWIGYKNYRTFWAESPIYGVSNAEFQEVGGSIDYNAYLDYIPYSGLTPYSNGYGKIYTTEHTFPASQFATVPNPWAVPSSIVISGAYTIEGLSETDTDFANGFYLRKEITASGLANVIYTRDELEKELYSLVSVLAKDNEGKELVSEDDGLLKFYNSGVIYDGEKSEKSANSYTLQIPADVDLTATPIYYKADGGKWEEVNSANLADANVMLQKNIGSAACFDHSRGFYYLPIRHYNTANYDGNFTYDADGKVINNSGEYGVVRNHIYEVKVGVIEGLAFGQPAYPDGTPGDEDLWEETTPLPDPEEVIQYKFKAELNILDWHLTGGTINL